MEEVIAPETLGGLEGYQTRLAVVRNKMMAATRAQTTEVEGELRKVWGEYHRLLGEASDALWSGTKVDPDTLERPPFLVYPEGGVVLPKGKGQHLVFLTDGLVISCMGEATGAGPEKRQASQLGRVKFRGEAVVLERSRGAVIAGRYAAMSRDVDELELDPSVLRPLTRQVNVMRNGLLLTIRAEPGAAEITVSRVK